MYQVMETTINCFSKSVSGLSGKTEDIGASDIWALLNYYLCSLKELTNCKIREIKSHIRMELGLGRIETDERDMESIFEGFKQ